MRRVFFKAFGVVTLLFSLPALIVVTLLMVPIFMALIADVSFSTPTFRQEFRTLIGLGFLTVVGVGLIFLRKWAAIYFSVPLFCYGFWLALSSIEPIRFPWNLFYVCEGISLMLPLIITIRVWSQLSWGGKWFF